MLSRIFVFLLFLVVISAEIVNIVGNNDETEKDIAQDPKPIINITKFDEEECMPKLDLVFLLDSSGSIEEIYQEHVKWAVALVDALQIEPDAVHVAAVQYAGFPLTEFALGTYPSAEDIRQHLKQINFQSGVTRTGYALRKAEAELFREDRGARKDALKVIILFTDGLSVDDPLKPATQLRDLKGVKIYVVSVSKDGFETEMSRIAGNKQNVFGPTELSRLRNALLNDAERARACSAIGASWFRRHDSVTLKSPSPLNGGLLPPLDFLELIGSKEEEDSLETDHKKEETDNKKVIGEVKPEVEFQRDDKKIVKIKSSTTATTATTTKVSINTIKNNAVESTTLKQSTITKTTSVPQTVLKILAKSTTPLPEKEKVKEQAKAFAVKNVESENAKDVFDMPEKFRKTINRKPAITTSTTPTPKKNTKLRKSTTIKVTTTIPTTKETTTSVPRTTFKPIKTKKTKKTTLRSTTTAKTTTTASTTASTTTSTTQKPTSKKFRPTLAKKIPTTTTQKSSTTKVISTTSKPTTIKPRTTMHSRFAKPQTIKNNADCELDLLFILDSSGSVQKIYDEQKAFLKEILEKTIVEENVHRVALLQFAGNSIQKTEWNFDAFQNTSNLIEALERVRLITGTTYIGAALRNAEKLLFERRQDVPTIVVLISDGFSQDDASQDAEKIRKLPNLDFYSLNISKLTNNAYLAELVGDSSRVFAGSDVAKFKDLITKRLKCR